MTITSENKRNQYTITAAQVVFPYTFRILDQEHLLVIYTTAAGIETELELTTNYTVSGVGGATGGNVTTCGDDSPYPTGDTITIIREVPLTQLTDYVEHDTFPAESHEDALDKLTMVVQQFGERLDRMVLLPKSSSYSDLTLPDPEDQKILQWKTDLTGLKNVTPYSKGDLTVTDFIESLLDDEDAAEFIATLGLTTTIAELNIVSNHGIDIPSGEIILFEKDTVVAGYILKVDKDDMHVYVTKGSVAGGEAGGSDKTGGTWTQPNHAHAGPSHTHTGPSHTHQWFNNITLAASSDQTYNSNGAVVDMPGPGIEKTGTARSIQYDKASGVDVLTDAYVKLGGTGNTGAEGAGATGGGATANTWRPPGRNFTRQQRN